MECMRELPDATPLDPSLAEITGTDGADLFNSSTGGLPAAGEIAELAGVSQPPNKKQRTNPVEHPPAIDSYKDISMSWVQNFTDSNLEPGVTSRRQQQSPLPLAASMHQGTWPSPTQSLTSLKERLKKVIFV